MIKSLLRRVATNLPIRLVPLDGALRISQRIAASLAGLFFIKDWQLEANGRPQFFKHQMNLARWAFEPWRWSFVARGVYAREVMFRGCKVLDLCCGDGSYSYLFFSDIAGSVVAVDVDPQAVAYAKKYNSSSNISFERLDIVREALPKERFDIVVWNAAVCYFTEEEIGIVLRKIIAVGAPGMKLVGMLPKANGWIDHKTEFSDLTVLEEFLSRYFESVVLRQLDEGTVTSFYFLVSAPRLKLESCI